MKKTILAASFLMLTAVLLLIFSCSEPAEEESSESPHPEGWSDSESPDFHGLVVLSDSAEFATCASCHGSDFQGGSSESSCYACHQFPHPAGWSAEDAHGEFVAADFDTVSNCAGCHLHQIQAESISWDCWDCHSYYPHAASISAFKHGGLLRSNHYQVWLCQTCHGENYSGGQSNFSCGIASQCHSVNPPDACNTCHGDFYASALDTTSWAPPPDLLGQTSESLISVGAHRYHVNPESISGQPWIGGPWPQSNYCGECHIIPDSVDASTHLDSLPPQAEITFGDLAIFYNEDSTLTNVIWSHQTAQCSYTYCHGNFELGNFNNPAPNWTNQDGTQIACGTCHLMPPPSPHLQNDNCSLCHGAVVAPDDSTIIAPNLHVNGEKN